MVCVCVSVFVHMYQEGDVSVTKRENFRKPNIICCTSTSQNFENFPKIMFLWNIEN